MSLSPVKKCNSSQMDLGTALVNNLADFQSLQIPPILFSVTYVGREKRILLH